MIIATFAIVLGIGLIWVSAEKLEKYSVLTAKQFGFSPFFGNEKPLVIFGDQLFGALVMLAIGLIPSYSFSMILGLPELLNVRLNSERKGLDPLKLPISPYPEWIRVSQKSSYKFY